MQPNRIREHLPSHFEGFDLSTVEFTTIDELLAVPFVSTWRHTPEFRRYCVWDRGPGLVMMFVVTAEGDGEEKSWVIGHLDHDIPDLPRFQKPEDTTAI